MIKLFKNCQVKLEIECKVIEGDEVYFKSQNQNIEGTVRRTFKLLSDGKINDYAFIIENETHLQIVIKVDELSSKTKDENKIANRYYLVKYKFKD